MRPFNRRAPFLLSPWLLRITLGLYGLWTATPGQLLAQTGTFLDRNMPHDLRVMSYNIYSDSIFDSSTAANKFDRLISAINPDVLALQEIYNHSANQVVNLMNSLAPLGAGATWYAHQAYDNVIVSKYPLSRNRTDTLPAGERQQAISLVDLPDAHFARDLYLFNNHYKCCGGFDNLRQEQSDAIVNWMRDARTSGGSIDLPGNTAMAVIGDLNIVDTLQPLNTLVTGDILDQSRYGPDSPPDWDGTANRDAHPLHNVLGPDDYTWRDDGSMFNPSRLDFMIYTDSVLEQVHQFVLNTTTMTSSELAATGLQAGDVVLGPQSGRFDHLPIVLDFQMRTIQDFGDLDQDGSLTCADVDLLETAVLSGTNSLRFDMNGDAAVNVADVQYWISDVYETLPGDANLDRIVDGTDFILWNQNKFQAERWCGGDFNLDGTVDGADFIIWNAYKFTSASPAVPEPQAWLLWLLSAGGVMCRVVRVRRLRSVNPTSCRAAGGRL